MAADAKTTLALIRAVRGCFNRLKAVADSLHSAHGVTGGMRAVMEALDESGEQTVPAIARSKSVTRQHIQVLVNDLVEAGLAATRDNPDDKRSPLVTLTKKGRDRFARMRGTEKPVIADLAQALSGRDLAIAVSALEALNAHLDNRLKKGDLK
jgi:DNA-binding MarR family transcriptional regulator